MSITRGERSKKKDQKKAKTKKEGPPQKKGKKKGKSNRKLRSQEEVHHINGDPGCNLSPNLVMLAAREHMQQHARWRRGPVGLQGRIRGPRHNQRRDVYIYIYMS